VDSSGVKVAELRYRAYGETRYSSGTTPTSRRFTGQLEEGTIGLYDYGARFYDPLLGRFLSADTVVPEPGNPQALNRYAYVLNNPLKYTDPSGHKSDPDGAEAEKQPNADPPPPPPLFPYDPNESVNDAWWLAWSWFFEIGPDPQCFGPDSSLTQDVMYDPGMKQFREKWAAAGYPLPWMWKHQADEREGGSLPVRIVKAGMLYIQENAQLALSSAGFGSRTREGTIDPVGGIIGSLDKIYVHDARNGMVMIVVENKMGLASGTRIPGTNWSIIQDRPRSAWGPGGTATQYFFWWEQHPLGSLVMTQ